MEWLKNFDLNRRWNIATAAGLAITLAAIAAKNRDGILIGLGIRINRPLGLIVTAIGFMLFALGLYGVIRYLRNWHLF